MTTLNHSEHHLIEDNDTDHAAIPLLIVADFDGNGVVNQDDIKDLESRINSLDDSQ